jgi:hypothetical protein
MYDFYFGTSESINEDPKKWLLTIKRMLPRWINGVPDSEFIALYEQLERLEEEKLFSKNKGAVLVETGCGATSLLLYFALKWDTELYTWDISSNKLAYLRGVLNDTLMKHFTFGKKRKKFWLKSSSGWITSKVRAIDKTLQKIFSGPIIVMSVK